MSARRNPQPRVFDNKTAAYAFSLSELFIRRLKPISDYISVLPAAEISNLTSSPSAIRQLSVISPAEFARRYFFKNLVKCAITIVHYEKYLYRHKQIIDVGSGPGTFVFPFRLHFKPASFVAIDRSAQALELANNLFSLVSVKPPVSICGHVPDCLVRVGGLVTASYLLTELDAHDMESFCALAANCSDTAFLVVDYPDVVDEFVSHVSRRRLIFTDTFSVRLPSTLARLIGDDHVSFSSAYAPSAQDY